MIIIVSPELQKVLLAAQQNEITEHHIYNTLAAAEKNPRNREILHRIGGDELRHYEFWKQLTGQDVRPRWLEVKWLCLLARILGITFVIKMLENGEEQAQVFYARVAGEFPDASQIEQDENQHEQELINLINEERLAYAGSMVLGLNDALVELTGALAGLTLALQNTRLVALTGLITGVAASLSMAASEYLSTKTEAEGKSPLKAAVYTGFAYVITVMLLILPYLVFTNPYMCLGLTLGAALLIIFLFTYYIAIAKDLPFGKRFLEMAGISLGVAIVTFGISCVIRYFWHIDV